MKAKEFVKSKYPEANALRVVRNGPFKEFYWLIFADLKRNTRLADGDDNKPESAAWAKAKREILNEEYK